MARFLTATLLVCLLSTSVSGQSLRVSVPSSVHKHYQGIIKRAAKAIERSGIQPELLINSNKRSLILLRNNEVDVELFRTPSVMSEFSNLIQLEPPILVLNFSMFTSIDNGRFCKMEASKFKTFSLAGIHGVELYQAKLAPMFSSYTPLSDSEAVFRFVSLGRADVGFIPKSFVEKVSKEEGLDLIVCTEHSTSLKFYAYMNKNSAIKREKLEQVLRSEFE